MAIFRAYIAPLLIVLTFLVAMVAVSARIFLPGDMMAPAPVTETPSPETSVAPSNTSVAGPTLPAAVSILLHGPAEDAA
ncbi:hypothetical protein XM38_000590 [Halomicronema hongdechloris C2206]|uniref:Uncharacterized protein n=1 Tax=Halomicronema hongdechloris C2206 TaxID=1641165 RepID=A0A1Z3HFS5_9CYAN|nr:hypothetical protein [Halomicronema hongdechloris]ASC69133.1 hypothetical protein XM38_000590 [Halomicronema hongdechloris C2206]